MTIEVEVLGAEALLAELRRRLAAAGSPTALAAQTGLSRTYLAYVADGTWKPGPRLAAALGFGVRQVMEFVPPTAADLADIDDTE